MNYIYKTEAAEKKRVQVVVCGLIERGFVSEGPKMNVAVISENKEMVWCLHLRGHLSECISRGVLAMLIIFC